MNEKHKLCFFGISCIVFLESLNMIVLQVDGIALSATIGGISGIIGFLFGRKVVKQ